jgi:acyl-CoA synthetase (AMP-forming)/AMP-acid ligase II
LHFAGRSKLIIKPKGYQVFPTEVEDYFEQKLKGKIAGIALIGVPHEVFTEGIMAFVEKSPIVDITIVELEAVASEMAAYKRPSHFEIIASGTLPLNRVAKTDYVLLREKAAEIAKRLRTEGKWDA